MCSWFAGLVKLGQPVPESNLVSDENNVCPQFEHVYMPFLCSSQYAPVNGASVPFSLVTWYVSGSSFAFHSSFVFGRSV